MVLSTNVNGLSPVAVSSGTTRFDQQCALCGGHRSNGSLLTPRVGVVSPGLWVCVDCQHKLARRVDDEGALGG